MPGSAAAGVRRQSALVTDGERPDEAGASDRFDDQHPAYGAISASHSIAARMSCSRVTSHSIRNGAPAVVRDCQGGANSKSRPMPRTAEAGLDRTSASDRFGSETVTGIRQPSQSRRSLRRRSNARHQHARPHPLMPPSGESRWPPRTIGFDAARTHRCGQAAVMVGGCLGSGARVVSGTGRQCAGQWRLVARATRNWPPPASTLAVTGSPGASRENRSTSQSAVS
jgi:hypothetical protein